MADIADSAQAHIDNHLDAAIHAAKRQHPCLKAVGICHNCTDPVPHSHLFCDTDCRDDYEKRVDGMRRNGDL